LRRVLITERQNAPWCLQPAQRQLYLEAKRWGWLRTWPTVRSRLVPTLLAPDLLKIVGPVAVMTPVSGPPRSPKQLHERGGDIQGSSATLVFPLEWNPTTKIDAEDAIHAASERFKRRSRKIERWYVPAGAITPLDVLLCQRTNLRWDHYGVPIQTPSLPISWYRSSHLSG